MTEQNPIIDAKTSNMTHYDQDLAECRAYAAQVDMGRNVGESALVGGAVGTGIGAIVGLFDKGSLGSALGAGAISGAVGGGIKGAASTYDKRKEVVSNCLKGRGYSVLAMQ